MKSINILTTMIMEKTVASAQQWIESGKPCIYRHGLAYRGARAKRISNEDALKLLPRYSFGIGFYVLSFITFESETALEFNELHENDLY